MFHKNRTTTINKWLWLLLKDGIFIKIQRFYFDNLHGKYIAIKRLSTSFYFNRQRSGSVVRFFSDSAKYLPDLLIDIQVYTILFILFRFFKRYMALRSFVCMFKLHLHLTRICNSVTNAPRLREVLYEA
jgi:hypothetical protein